MIETELGIDVRKSLFYALAERNWPLVGLEALGMSLEDIFLSIVDHTTGADKSRRSKSKGRSAERDAARDIMSRTRKAQNADAKGDSVSGLFDGDKEN